MYVYFNSPVAKPKLIYMYWEINTGIRERERERVNPSSNKEVTFNDSYFISLGCEDCCKRCCYSTPYVTLFALSIIVVGLIGFITSSVYAIVIISTADVLSQL